MFFAVSKIVFDEESTTSQDAKELKSLVEKIRARFKVCAHAQADENAAAPLALGVAMIGNSEEQVNQTLDSIVEFCESSGFGRVADEHTLMDDMDHLQEDYGGDEEEETDK